MGVQLCDKLGWTYQQYAEQPAWFISMLLMKYNLDGKKAESDRKAEELKARTGAHRR